MSEPENELLAYLRRPTRRRLGKVVKAYHELVWSTAYRITRNRADAEDIAQDVFLKLLLHPPKPETVRSPAAFFAWSVIGRATNLRRADQRRQERETKGTRAAEADGVSVDDVDALHRAIASLPDDLRGPIELRYLAGLRNAAIAAALSIAERTVEDRLQRGREALRAKLKHASLGLGALLAALEARSEAPAEVLSRLLQVAELGSALSLSVTTASIGGGLMAKKALLVAGLLALAALVPISVGVWSNAGRARRLEVTSSTATTPVPAASADARRASADLESAAAATLPPPKAPLASLRGVVRDEDQEPLAEATIRLRPRIPVEGTEGEETFGDAFDLKATSNEAGEYAFNSVPPGPVYLTASADGLLLMWSRRPAQVKENESSVVDLVLFKPRRLMGALRDPRGVPITNGAVWLPADVATYAPESPLSRDHRDPPYVWMRPFPVDGRGAYDTGLMLIVSFLVPHSYPLSVRAVAKGYALSVEKLDRPQLQDLEARLDFVLEPEMPVSLMVVDASGAAIEDAKVGLGSEGSGFMDSLHETVETDARGRAMLEHFPPQRHRLRIEKEGYRVASIFVEPGSSTDLRVTLSPLGPGVVSRVTFDEAFPADERRVHHVCFEYRDESGELTRIYDPRSRRDPDTQELTFWPEPGTYVLRVELGLLSWATESFRYTGEAPVRADIHVTTDPPYVAGTVVRAGTGEPVPGVRVTAQFVSKDEDFRSSWRELTRVRGFIFTGRPGNAKVTQTDAQGRFFLLLPRDNGRQQFWSPASSVASFTVGSEELGWAPDFAMPFDRSTALENLRFELHPNGWVEGQITADGETPVPGELVAASDFQGWTHHTKSDDHGRYRIDRLRPGNYLVLPLGRETLTLIGRGLRGEELTEGLPSPHELFERPVTVASGEGTPLDLDLRTARLGRIEGSVAAGIATATRLSFARVIGGIPRRVKGLADEVPIESGRFVAENLLDGTYRLQVLGRDRSDRSVVLAETDVVVRRGAVAEAHLESPRAALRVPLRTAVGALPDEARVIQAARPDQAGRLELWSGWDVEREGDSLHLDGLPPGLVKVQIAAPGHAAVWSEPVRLTEGGVTNAAPLELAPGRDIVVRLQVPEGFPVPMGPRFWLNVGDEPATVEHILRRVKGQDSTWALSAFRPGTYRLSCDPGDDLERATADVTVTGERDAEILLQLVVKR